MQVTKRCREIDKFESAHGVKLDHVVKREEVHVMNSANGTSTVLEHDRVEDCDPAHGAAAQAGIDYVRQRLNQLL